ncbi:hypothetical protein [Bacillus sp. PS06]|uniref:hypothetical protein n=1 Tax=Bacillus sp. PS06 TaxID=2764176 RepID=UPI0017835C1D|nr:hypothetical protein [Bacillus sp. PS06]MBD8069773.1 hypothetical protein [Bacillus sp. PS06]
MNEKSFEDTLSDLFKNTVTIEPRELLPFKGGLGLFRKCIERYIQNNTKQLSEKGKSFEAKCSYVSKKEERLFNDVLFDLLLDPEYVYETELYVILEEFSKLVKMTYEEIRHILYGLSMIQIKIRGEGGSPLIISSLFPGCETGNCLNTDTGNYDSKDQFFALRINAEFLNACSEIKAELGK